MRMTEEEFARYQKLVTTWPKKKPKYGNVVTTYLEERFDSKKEARRYQELLLMQRAGEIWNLKRQVRYPLEVNGIKICTYVSDFEYDTHGGHVTEDVKGYSGNRVYIIKRKLMLACFGITIIEI